MTQPLGFYNRESLHTYVMTPPLTGIQLSKLKQTRSSLSLYYFLKYIFFTSRLFDLGRHFQHSLSLNSSSCNFERSWYIVWDCGLNSRWGSLSPSSCHTLSYRSSGRGHVAEGCRFQAAGALGWCTWRHQGGSTTHTEHPVWEAGTPK